MSFRHPAEIAAEIDVLSTALSAMREVNGVPVACEGIYAALGGPEQQGGSEDDGSRLRRERRNFRAEIRAAEAQIRDRRAEYRSALAAWPLGCEAVAEMLGVKLGTVHIWVRRSAIVARDGTIGGAPWWWRASIVAWAVASGRLDAADPEAAADGVSTWRDWRATEWAS
jgi:hypothetical protein